MMFAGQWMRGRLFASGSLSHDFTDARARVTSIAGGAQGNPERMVC